MTAAMEEGGHVGKGAPAADEGANGDAGAVVVRAVMAEKRLAASPDEDAELARDLGFSSFDMMVLCVRIEEGLGRPVDFGALVGVRTVGDLVRAVDEGR